LFISLLRSGAQSYEGLMTKWDVPDFRGISKHATITAFFKLEKNQEHYCDSRA
jgi:hypothetical protein